MLSAVLSGNKFLAVTPSWSELTPRERKHHLELESEEGPWDEKTETGATPSPKHLPQPGQEHWESLPKEPSLGHPHGWELSRTEERRQYGQLGWQKGSGFFSRLPRGS